MLFNEIEADLDDKQRFLVQQGDSIEQMVNMYRTLLIKINVLTHAEILLRQPNRGGPVYDIEDSVPIPGREGLKEPLIARSGSGGRSGSAGAAGEGPLRLCYMGGSLQKEDQQTFKKLVFRATRGKAFTQFYDLKIAKGDQLRSVNDHNDKVVYIIMFEEGKFMKDRI